MTGAALTSRNDDPARNEDEDAGDDAVHDRGRRQLQ